MPRSQLPRGDTSWRAHPHGPHSQLCWEESAIHPWPYSNRRARPGHGENSYKPHVPRMHTQHDQTPAPLRAGFWEDGTHHSVLSQGGPTAGFSKGLIVSHIQAPGA